MLYLGTMWHLNPGLNQHGDRYASLGELRYEAVISRYHDTVDGEMPSGLYNFNLGMLYRGTMWHSNPGLNQHRDTVATVGDLRYRAVISR